MHSCWFTASILSAFADLRICGFADLRLPLALAGLMLRRLPYEGTHYRDPGQLASAMTGIAQERQVDPLEEPGKALQSMPRLTEAGELSS